MLPQIPPKSKQYAKQRARETNSPRWEDKALKGKKVTYADIGKIPFIGYLASRLCMYMYKLHRSVPD